MARKVFKRLTQPVYGPDGAVVHQPGEVLAEDAPLDPAARFEYVTVDPDDTPPPAWTPPAAAESKSATVKAEPAQGKGAAHK